MAQNDLIPVNGWTITSLPGLVSPAFHKLQGLSKKTGIMTTIDAGTNRQLNFSDGIEECGPITLLRTRDGSPDDAAFAAFFDNTLTGKKVNGVFTQYRHGKEVLKIAFTGLVFGDYSLTDFDTNQKGDSAKSDQKYQAHVDHWEETYTAIS
jgi:hypothetical protein